MPKKQKASRRRKAAVSQLSHVSTTGEARMVDVSAKPVTQRLAVASALVRIKPAVLDLLFSGKLAKGDALGAARIAGLQAAKRTAEWIPMCHPLALDHLQIDLARAARGTLRILCAAKTIARTGVEMEALVGAAVAALTIYDMVKSADRNAVIGPIRLEEKSGGKSGHFRRSP